MIVHVAEYLSVLESFEFFLGGHTGSACAAFEDSREFEFLGSGFGFWRDGELDLYFVEDILRDDGFVADIIVIPTPNRIFEFPGVIWIPEHEVDGTQGDFLSASRRESFRVEPPIDHPSALAFRDALEHLPDDRRTDRIEEDALFSLETVLVAHVPERGNAGTPAHRGLSPHASFHVDAPVVVLEFRLTPENHKEKLLIRGVGERLSVGTDFLEESLIHEIDERAEVAGVPAQSVGGPGEDPVEFPFADVLDDSVEDGTFARVFRRVTLAPDVDDFDLVPFRLFEHLVDLGINGKRLPFIALTRLSRVETIAVFIVHTVLITG